MHIKMNTKTIMYIILVLIISLQVVARFTDDESDEVKKPDNSIELYEEPEYEEYDGYDEETEEIIQEAVKSNKDTAVIVDSHYLMELAYYEGQKDAIEGKIRIEMTESGKYTWIESPWDGGRKPTFNPLTVKDE